MLKGVLSIKLKKKLSELKTINDEISAFGKDFQKADASLQELLPQEDKLLMAYFEAINTYMQANENNKVDAKVINGSDAINTVKGYDMFAEEADLVVIRYTYWVPSYSYIIRR